MTIIVGSGDLLDQKVDAIVNTVNTVGVMGKGIALQFKRKWPENFKAYERACKAGQVQVGKMFVHDNGGLVHPHFIINFPTKEHWKGKSKFFFIESGLRDLAATVVRLEIKSIAIPPLGCGNGGLDWSEVRPLIEDTFDCLPDLRVVLFEPATNEQLRAISPEVRPVRMTPGRSAIVAILNEYQRMCYSLSMLEVQKLAYFLSCAGEKLDLGYVKEKFGPYSQKLRHVLVKMDGAYISGVGDLNSPSEIAVLPGAIDGALEFLHETSSAETLERVTRVSQLIEGYESPYGLELLSTVHWVAKELSEEAMLSDVIVGVQSWNERKRQIMPPKEIALAHERLAALSWLA